jgi:hypothetical protein
VANRTQTLVTISESDIGQRIYTLRGTQVMIDHDLARIYNVETKTLKRAVRRNIERFPSDFMFEPTIVEDKILRYQIGTSKISSNSHGGNRYNLFVFTESGVAMLSSVLNSRQAIQINIEIMRAFILFRTKYLTNHIELSNKIGLLESNLAMLDQRVTGLENNLHEAPSISNNLPISHRIIAIQKAVAHYWGLNYEELISKSRNKPISLARHVAIFLIRKHLHINFKEIGRYFGHRDHTSILYAFQKILNDSERNQVIRSAVALLEQELQHTFS